MKKWVKITVAGCLGLLIMNMLAGCGSQAPEPSESMSPPGRILVTPQDNLPVLDLEDGLTIFKWQGIEYDFVYNDHNPYVVSYLSDRHARLDLNRQKVLMVSPNAWTPYFKQADAEITGSRSLEQGILLTASDSHGGWLLLHLRNMNDQTPLLITRTEKGAPDYLVSSDNRKIVFMNETDTIAVYDSKTEQVKELSELTAERFCSAWANQMTVSPKGNYVTYEEKDCEEHPHQFIIMDAVSGRLIRTALPGSRPQWDQNENYVAFLLNPFGMADDGTTSNQSVQVAVYSLINNDIEFLNRVPEGFHITIPPLFSADNSYILYGAQNEAERIFAVYHRHMHVQQILTSTLSETSLLNGEHVYFNYPDLVLPDSVNQSLALTIYDLENEQVELITDIDDWGLENADSQQVITYYTVTTEETPRFFYIKNGSLIQYGDGNHQVKLMFGDESRIVGLDTAGKWLIVAIRTSKGDMEMRFINL